MSSLKKLAIAGVVLFGTAFGADAGTDARTIAFDATVWKALTPPGKRDAEFMVGRDGGLMVQAETAVSFYYREIESLDVMAGPLIWSWRVDTGLPGGDLASAGHDDRPLALHVWFPKPASERSLIEDLQGALGFPVVGRALTYVWGGDATRGTMLDNPHLPGGRQIILRNAQAPIGRWFREEVDLASDFERAFGRQPSRKARFIAISSDSDDLGGLAVGKVTDIRLGRSTYPRPGEVRSAGR